MSELEKLINEQRRINDQIRLLKEGCSNFGQFDSVRYLQKADADDERVWQVSSRMVQTHREHESWEEAKMNGHESREVKVEFETGRWQVFVREKTKEEAISKIKQIINDLNKVIDAWNMEDETK